MKSEQFLIIFDRFLFSGNVDVAEVLVRNNADVNSKNSLLKTPLHFAIEYGNCFSNSLFLVNKMETLQKDSVS